MKKLVLLILAIASLQLTAQNSNRKFIEGHMTSHGIVNIKVSDGVYTITPYSDQIIETTFVPEGQELHKHSHAVVMRPKYSKPEFKESTDKVVFKTSGMEVHIQKSPFKIAYYYKGKLITSEKNGYSKHENSEHIQFNLNDTEVLYGAGARALPMNRRGYRLELYNRAHYGYETHSELMNYTMPLVLSSELYAIHFDNAPIGFLDLDSKKDNTLTYETISGRKTYQIVVGDSWLDLIANYTDLTGKQPLLPRWALGNFSSRFGYHTETETRNTVEKFQEEEIPLDAVILDIFWFGKDIQGHMGNLEFLKDSFPTPQKMIDDFQAKGVQTVLISEPFILTTSNRWYEAVLKDVLAKDSLGNPFTYDFYFGNTGLVDIYKPEGERWFWNIYKKIANMGVTGVWGDLGEPEVHPKELLHATGTADEVHNIYGHDWARLVYEGYQRDFPEQRPFILMRAGYSGSQRYGMIPWSGDVNRTWGGLQAQPKIALQMAMQGMGYMHSDLGGFAGPNLDDELYVRWLQYGVFQPIYRPHAQQEVPSEPVFRLEKAKLLAKEAIKLRYQLLPYIYTLAWENNQTGAPLMRSIFFEESDNLVLYDYSKTYLWGNDFLVAPILEQGQESQEVYFPKSGPWFDFYSDQIYDGGQTKTFKTGETSIPTFVRAGAFIPMAKPMLTTKDYNANELDIHYYHHAEVSNSERVWYNDDGLLQEAFEKGAFEIVKASSKASNKKLNISLEAELGKLQDAQDKNYTLIIHNVSKTPKFVKINKEKVDYSYNNSNQTLELKVSWNSSKEVAINLKF
ncbi:glycoside hydrolase family 31 protein [Urechidicola sp. KH5]